MSGTAATVAGGADNGASAWGATVGGGQTNTASGQYSNVSGGLTNEAGGYGAMVPGGRDNMAKGNYSLAGGRGASDNGANGVFVWGDSSTQTVLEATANAFTVQAGGGAQIYSSSDLSTGVELPSGGGSWSGISTRTAKTDISPVAPEAVLSKVESLEVSRWEYDSDEDATHMGPMAEAFHDAFGLGHDPERITNIDADGVAFAAIQGLTERLERKTDRIDELEAENEGLRDDVDALEAKNEALRERVAAIEDQISLDGADGQATPADD